MPAAKFRCWNCGHEFWSFPNVVREMQGEPTEEWQCEQCGVKEIGGNFHTLNNCIGFDEATMHVWDERRSKA